MGEGEIGEEKERTYGVGAPVCFRFGIWQDPEAEISPAFTVPYVLIFGSFSATLSKIELQKKF